MKSQLDPQFREAFSKLPKQIQDQARKAYRLFKDNSQHPRLHFKPIQGAPHVYSARIGLYYRAMGVLEEDTIT